MKARFVRLLAAISFGALVGARNATSRSPVARQSQTYTIQHSYQGNDFFNDWTFFTGQDPTSGLVNYVNQQQAQSDGLAYVDGNGNFVMQVDSWSSIPVGGNRNSVRITSNTQYNEGLFILDALTMPVGCGTWPSFWTVGPDWPFAGEIDIVEGVNNQPHNQMTLHSGTSHPCTINTGNTGSFTGSVLNPHCYSTETSDSGCSVKDNSPSSFGNGFNNVGGGVYAFLWNPSQEMSMWFFPSGDIPGDIIQQNPDPSSWGTPAAFWGVATCDFNDNFYQHSMVFDIDICGNWAKGEYPQSGCPGTCATIVANAANFQNAQWTISSVTVYQLGQ